MWFIRSCDPLNTLSHVGQISCSYLVVSLSSWIKAYHLYNDHLLLLTVSTYLDFQMSTSVLKEQTVTILQPSTSYTMVVEMCNLEHLCTRGPPGYITTLPAPPSGQGSPRILSISANNATVKWDRPQEPNGKITR